SMVEEASERLREHRLDPTRFKLHLRWVNRATLEYGIVLATKGHKHFATCTVCSELELKHRVLESVDMVISEIEIKQARAKQDTLTSPPPPSRPAVSPPVVEPIDPQWPARRGAAAALLALGGTAMIVGCSIIPLGTRRE